MVRWHEDVHVRDADALVSVDLLALAIAFSGVVRGFSAIQALEPVPYTRHSALPGVAGTSDDLVRMRAWSGKLAMLQRMVTIAPPHRSA